MAGEVRVHYKEGSSQKGKDGIPGVPLVIVVEVSGRAEAEEFHSWLALWSWRRINNRGVVLDSHQGVVPIPYAELEDGEIGRMVARAQRFGMRIYDQLEALGEEWEEGPLHIGDRVAWHKDEEEKWETGVVVEVSPRLRVYCQETRHPRYLRNVQLRKLELRVAE